jgi:hypothetical protein
VKAQRIEPQLNPFIVHEFSVNRDRLGLRRPFGCGQCIANSETKPYGVGKKNLHGCLAKSISNVKCRREIRPNVEFHRNLRLPLTSH